MWSLGSCESSRTRCKLILMGFDEALIFRAVATSWKCGFLRFHRCFVPVDSGFDLPVIRPSAKAGKFPARRFISNCLRALPFRLTVLANAGTDRIRTKRRACSRSRPSPPDALTRPRPPRKRRSGRRRDADQTSASPEDQPKPQQPAESFPQGQPKLPPRIATAGCVLGQPVQKWPDADRTLLTNERKDFHILLGEPGRKRRRRWRGVELGRGRWRDDD